MPFTNSQLQNLDPILSEELTFLNAMQIHTNDKHIKIYLEFENMFHVLTQWLSKQLSIDLSNQNFAVNFKEKGKIWSRVLQLDLSLLNIKLKKAEISEEGLLELTDDILLCYLISKEYGTSMKVKLREDDCNNLLLEKKAWVKALKTHGQLLDALQNIRFIAKDEILKLKLITDKFLEELPHVKRTRAANEFALKLNKVSQFVLYYYDDFHSSYLNIFTSLSGISNEIGVKNIEDWDDIQQYAKDKPDSRTARVVEKITRTMPENLLTQHVVSFKTYQTFWSDPNKGVTSAEELEINKPLLGAQHKVVNASYKNTYPQVTVETQAEDHVITTTSFRSFS